MAYAQHVGSPVRRLEDPRLVRGRGLFVDDVHALGSLHAAFFRSDFAHARIRSLNVERARRHPGVFAVLTGADVLGKIGTIPCKASVLGMATPIHSPLATDKVCFVGQPIAMVVARDAYTAHDAVQLIDADFEPLPTVIDPEEAARPDAPKIHDDLQSNVCYRIFGPASDALGLYTKGLSTRPLGLTDSVFARAEHQAEFRLVQQRVGALPLEGRAVLAVPDGAGSLTVWASTQIPHWMRTLLAEALQIAETRVRVIAPDVGGGFGCKIQLYPEEMLVPYAALALGRPVRWVETRRENLAATVHGRGQVQHVRVAFDGRGRILALKAKIYADLGAYLYFFTPAIPRFTGLIMSGCYDIGVLEFEVVGCFTNKIATDAYRGAGRPEATCIAERAVDVVARTLGLDPAEVRRRNFLRSFPARTAGGLVYDSGDYSGALDKLLAVAQYDRLRAEQAEARKRGRLVGIGLCTYVEVAGFAPSHVRPPGLGGWESCTVRVDPTGSVTVLTGLSPHGQGTATAFAQIVADELGVPLDAVRVVHGDTDVVQYGNGTMGSRGISVGGGALVEALAKIKLKARQIAAAMLEADVEDIRFDHGNIFVGDQPERKVGFAEVAAKATDWTFISTPRHLEPGLDATSRYEPPAFTYPFGAHLAAVEIDRDTGAVTVTKYVAVDDCGTIINPLLVQGQVHGGVAQGLGQVLLEGVTYDEGGQLVTGTLMDYAVPRADVMPLDLRVDHTITPNPNSPLGAKGAGEAGTVGAVAAVLNAVHDALAPLGIEVPDMPLTASKIWEALHGRLREVQP